MLILAILLSACLMIYVGFVVLNARRFAQINCESLVPQPLLPEASIIIPARNEAGHISSILFSALSQVYNQDRLEVILVDDHSTDKTLAIAQVMAQQHAHLTVLTLPEGKMGKKAALAAGVEAAKGEIILQTDADCELGPRWAWTMVSHFRGRTGLVLGPVSLRSHHSIWQKLQSLEIMGLQALTAGSAARQRPNMANGANMAFLKKAFVRVKGYEQIDKVASGDDELLVQKIRLQTSFQVQYAKCQDAIVRTPGQESWAAFRSQRLRWVSKARAYLDRRINLIQLISYLGFLCFPVLVFLGFKDSAYWELALELFVLKCVGDLILMYYAARFFYKLPLLRYYLLLELVYIPYVLWVGLAGNLIQQYNWKDRWVT